MNKLIILLIFIAILSCKNDNAESSSVATTRLNDKTTTQAGPDPSLVAPHDLKIIVDKPGASPKVGDIVTYSQKTYLNDSLLTSTNDIGFALSNVLPHDSIVGKPYNPTYATMFKLSEGDSAFIIQYLTEMDSLPNGISKSDVFKYEIKLFKIETKEDAMEQMNHLSELNEQIKPEIMRIASDYTAGKLGDQFRELEKGITYKIVSEGDGDYIRDLTPVFMNFNVTKLDGTSIFNTMISGSSINVPFGSDRMIPGLEKIMKKYPKGTKGYCVLSPEQLKMDGQRISELPEDEPVIVYFETEKI